MKKFKIISSLTEEMKKNFYFVSYIYKIKDIPNPENSKIGDAVFLKRYKFRKPASSEIYVFDGIEWCKYNVDELIFESSNFDTIGEVPHPSGKGILVVLYNFNWEAKFGLEYFLIGVSNDLRRCRIYANKPEYLVGYDETCKLTKEEKEAFIKMLSDGGWNKYLRNYNSYQDIKHIDDTIKTRPMPNYSLLETED